MCPGEAAVRQLQAVHRALPVPDEEHAAGFPLHKRRRHHALRAHAEVTPPLLRNRRTASHRIASCAVAGKRLTFSRRPPAGLVMQKREPSIHLAVRPPPFPQNVTSNLLQLQ